MKLILLDFNAARVGEEKEHLEMLVPEGGRTLQPYLTGGTVDLPNHSHIFSLNYYIIELYCYLNSNSNTYDVSANFILNYCT